MTDLAGVDDNFDPELVPMYPLLRVELRGLDEGGYAGLVDDEVVATDLELEPVRSAIIGAAARAAAQRQGGVKAIRVRGLAPDGGLFQMVVSATGHIHEMSPGTASSTSPVATTTAPAQRWGRKRKRHLKGPDRVADKGTRVHPILLVIVGFPLAMTGFFIWILFGQGGAAPDTAAVPEPRQLPVVAPAGYSPVATWAVKVGTASGTTTGGVDADAERVYAATGSTDHVTAYATRNGRKEWSTDLGSPVATGPSITMVEGAPVVVAATSTKLLTLDPTSGEELGEWKFEATSGSQVRITATGPVVLGRSNTAQIIVDGQLVTRIMPATAEPVAPGPRGSLIAVSPGRVYTSRSATVSGHGRPLSTPRRGEMTVAGWTGDHLVLAYSASSATSNAVRLIGYAAPAAENGDWAQQWTTGPIDEATAVEAGNDLPLVSAPDGRWGVYGSSAVTLGRGKVTPLRGWSTTAVGDQIAFGTTATRVLSAGPGGLGGRSAPEPASQQVTAPQAVQGATAYLVTGGGETTAWLYALTPEGGERP